MTEADILETVLYYYQWQNALEQALAWAHHAGLEVTEEIAVERNTLRLQLRLPVGMDRNGARQKLLDAVNQDGITLIFTGEVAAPQPIPAPPWWERLTITSPRTKIYSAKDAVQIYYSSGPDTLPSSDQKAHTSSELPWTLPLGKDVDVWRASITGSGWVCVAVRERDALWVRGEDMRKEPL